MSLIGKKMTFPTTIRAGDYVQWRIPASQDVFGNSISSPDWSVVYYLRTNILRAETAPVTILPMLKLIYKDI